MEIQTAIHVLHPRGSFRIARKRSVPFANVIVRLEHEGVVGWGEASPNSFYQESAEEVVARLHRLRAWLTDLRLDSVDDLEEHWRKSWEILAPSRAAQCALDLALWDWLARRKEVSVTRLALGRPAQPIVSFATIGISTPEELEGKLSELRGFPRVKIKSDASGDFEPLRRVRSELGVEIAIDPNCSWNSETLAERCTAGKEAGAAFVEQPLPHDKNHELRRGAYALPLFADESCVTEADVPKLVDHFDGINVKLVKCGGLTPALRMLRAADELGMQTMVGCMLESSVLIAAGCVAAQLANYADLDGAWLVGNDPFDGWGFDHGKLHPTDRLGLGVEPRDELLLA